MGNMERSGVATVRSGRRVQSRKQMMVRYVEALPRRAVILEVVLEGSEADEEVAEREVVGRTVVGRTEGGVTEATRLFVARNGLDFDAIELYGNP
mmetsp:Transcript_3239/g.6801  ORF Transcript_3239/g.6801 Transcript_3239/m.6801 type:complete len:95 (+) Transcript_3239:298-582(+)